jgi:hypothetical protein
MPPVLQQIVADLARGLKAADTEGPEYRSYQPGIGPHAEGAALRLALEQMKETAPGRYGEARLEASYPEESRKSCDLLVPGEWAVEAKLARPFRDNGDESPHWIEGVLYPYDDNKGMVGDCLKLRRSAFKERKALVAIGYEHDPPEIEVETAMDAFELVAEKVQAIDLGPRRVSSVEDLIHPVHERLDVYGWEVSPSVD